MHRFINPCLELLLGVDMSESNFDSPFGRLALRTMYEHIGAESEHLPKGVTEESLMESASVKDAFVPSCITQQWSMHGCLGYGK